MLLNLLLTIHLLAIVAWLGGAWRTLLIRKKIKEARGTAMEVPLIEVELGYGPVYFTAIVLVAVTGIIMSISTELGFFQVFWLSVKQAIMVAILIGLVVWTIPWVGRVHRELKAIPANPGEATESLRSTLRRGWLVNDVMDLGVLINVLLAIWKPR